MIRHATLIFALWFAAIANAAWTETGNVVESRPGVKLSYVVAKVVSSPAVHAESASENTAGKHLLLLLTGGAGAIRAAAEGIREHDADRPDLRGYLAEQLGMVVTPGLPSDQPQGLSIDWRDGAQHAADLGAVMEVMISQYPAALITVIGISNGCISAAHISAAARKRWGANFHNVVLLSCSRDAFREHWLAALDGAGLQLKVPLLVVHHRRDSCLHYENVAAQAARYDFIVVDDVNQPRPSRARRDCTKGSAHVYGGKEEKVYQAVVEWIITGKSAAIKN